jgi:DNA-binding protein H-NS
MASMNVDKLSLKELLDLENRVKKALATARQREQAEARAKIEAIAKNAGMTAAEILGLAGKQRGARKGGKVAPKYMNPDNKSETWTGRGRQPRWLSAKLSKGGKLADYAI